MKATKRTGRAAIFALLAIMTVGVVVAASVLVVWTKTTTVTVTPKVTVVMAPGSGTLSLIQNTSQVYWVNVTNPGTKNVTVTLNIGIVGGSNITASLVGMAATQVIATNATFAYKVSVAASATASGAATLTWTISQTYGA